MIKVAIVEDEASCVDELKSFISRFSAETGYVFQAEGFLNPVAFLENYSCDYDIIFLDIMIPLMNGMDVAKRIREKDNSVMIIFVTNMSKFAIRGYEVEAFDFIVKPLIYNEFAMKMNRAMLRLNNVNVLKFPVTTKNTTVMIVASEVCYIEVLGHNVVFHTVRGDISIYGTLKKFMDNLPEESFVQCNRSYVINLEYIDRIEGNNVYIKDAVIAIGTKKKKQFMEAVGRYFEGKRDVFRK